MDDPQSQHLEALMLALFDSFAHSLWVQLRSAGLPNVARSAPPEPLAVIDIQFSIISQDRLRGLRLPAPSSPLPQPWGQPWGSRSADWADNIRMWLEEQVAQGCDYWAMKKDGGYALYFDIDSKGLRVDESKGRLTASYLNI